MSVDPYEELMGICQSEMRDLEKLYAAWDDALRHTDTQAEAAAYRKRVKRLRVKTDKCVRMVGDLNLSVRAVGRADLPVPAGRRATTDSPSRPGATWLRRHPPSVSATSYALAGCPCVMPACLGR